MEERYLPPGTFLTPIQAAILFEIYNNQYLVLSLFVSRRDSEAYIAAVGARLLKGGYNIYTGQKLDARLLLERDGNRELGLAYTTPPLPAGIMPTRLSNDEARALAEAYKTAKNELRSLSSLQPSKYVSSSNIRQQQQNLVSIEKQLRDGGYDTNGKHSISLPDDFRKFAEVQEPERHPVLPSLPPITSPGFRHIYSGCDIKVTINAGGNIVEVGNLATLTYSLHRDKPPVRVLGRVRPKAYARGSNTLAGSLVWAIFDESAMAKLPHQYDFEYASDTAVDSILASQLPPFDITIVYSHEVPGEGGTTRQAVLRLFGVEIVDEGQSHSTDDLFFENVMQYVARDIHLMAPVVGEGGETTFKGSRPQNQALFTAGANRNAQLLSWQNQLQTLGAERDHIASELQKESKRLANLYLNIGPEDLNFFEEQDKNHGLIDRLSQQLRKIDAQIAELRVKMKESQSTEHTRILTDPTSDIRDNPFDPVSYSLPGGN